MPIGFRSAWAQVRNYEWRVAKAREALAEQEMEVAQELAVAFQNVAAAYQTAQSYFNRRVATERELALYQYQYEAGTTTLAFVLQAQSSLASAEQNYYTSLSTTLRRSWTSITARERCSTITTSLWPNPTGRRTPIVTRCEMPGHEPTPSRPTICRKANRLRS